MSEYRIQVDLVNGDGHFYDDVIFRVYRGDVYIATTPTKPLAEALVRLLDERAA